jgi:hypothetical protein
VAADIPWKTCQDFVDYAKKNVWQSKFAHPGMDTAVAYCRPGNLKRQPVENRPVFPAGVAVSCFWCDDERKGQQIEHFSLNGRCLN